jgi:hypothetical protein
MATTLPNDVIERIKNASERGRNYFNQNRTILDGNLTDEQFKRDIAPNVFNLIQDKSITPQDRIAFLQQEWQPKLQSIINRTTGVDEETKNRARKYLANINNLISNLQKQTSSSQNQPQQNQNQNQNQQKNQPKTEEDKKKEEERKKREEEKKKKEEEDLSWAKIDIVQELNKCERELIRSIKSERVRDIVQEEDNLENAPVSLPLEAELEEESDSDEETTETTGTTTKAGTPNHFWLMFKYIKLPPSKEDGVVFYTPVQRLNDTTEVSSAMKKYQQETGPFSRVDVVIQFNALVIGVKEAEKNFYVLGLDDTLNTVMGNIFQKDFHTRFEMCAMTTNLFPLDVSQVNARPGTKLLPIKKTNS